MFEGERVVVGEHHHQRVAQQFADREVRGRGDVGVPGGDDGHVERRP
ncbi:hypothetical protein [Actinoallomurus acanthiterrae]